MRIFVYDKSFEGLLTCVFEAYERRSFPDILLGTDDGLPLFYEEVVEVVTQEPKSARVWKGLEKRLSAAGLSVVTTAWLSELAEMDLVLFRYMCKAIDSSVSIELNFGDPDVLKATQISKKVSRERLRIVQFMRFQKAADGSFFGACEPLYNALPIALGYFKDRFADQRWLIYDMKREYGYYYDLSTISEVYFDEKPEHLLSGRLEEELMDSDERFFQELWRAYFKSTGIKERANPKLHRQHLPRRFWKYLTEKQ